MGDQKQNIAGNLSDDLTRHIHCLGIGGVGMGGLAEILLRQGHKVSGSDVATNKMTDRLTELGALIQLGHHPEQIDAADSLVYSSAIQADNPELIAAKAAGLRILHRGEMLAEIMQGQTGIAVSGTHGKTTTTSLITTVLKAGNLDPSFMIGGQLLEEGSNAYLGEGEYFVAEADESDASMLYLAPKIIVVTNIDVDHMETYNNDFSVLKKTFLDFLNKLPEDGLAVLCIDDPIIAELFPEIKCRKITYGFSAGADIAASKFVARGLESHFSVKIFSKTYNDIILNSPGKHNVLNALAAIAVASDLVVDIDSIKKGLQHFSGVGRRFRIIGERKVKGKTVKLIDDYAHHPREVAATYSAACDAFPGKKIIAIFQPHRFSRTRDLWEDFVSTLSEIDDLVLLDIYAAGESPIEGVSGQALVGNIANEKCILIEDNDKLAECLDAKIQDGDVLLFMGAGNISQLAHQLVNGGDCKQ